MRSSILLTRDSITDHSHTDHSHTCTAELISLLERFSYERKEAARPGWAALALREAGTPFDPIFACYDELLTSKVRVSFAPSKRRFTDHLSVNRFLPGTPLPVSPSSPLPSPNSSLHGSMKLDPHQPPSPVLSQRQKSNPLSLDTKCLSNPFPLPRRPLNG